MYVFVKNYSFIQFHAGKTIEIIKKKEYKADPILDVRRNTHWLACHNILDTI